MTDTAIVTELRPSPRPGEGAQRIKDPTAALRARRARRKRKAVSTLTPGVPGAPIAAAEKLSDIKPSVTVGEIEKRRFLYADATAYAAAIALPAPPRGYGRTVLVALAVAMEAAKLVTAGWLARRWRDTAWLWRTVLVALVAGLAVINGAGVYAQLVAAHVDKRGEAAAVLETQDAALAARIEAPAHTVADLDRHLGQIDTAIEEAARRGRTNAAMALMETQRRARAGLADERNREAGTHWQPSRRNAPASPPRRARPTPRQRPSATWRSSSALTRTQSRRSGG
jgi:hypothetical protein